MACMMFTQLTFMVSNVSGVEQGNYKQGTLYRCSDQSSSYRMAMNFSERFEFPVFIPNEITRFAGIK